MTYTIGFVALATGLLGFFIGVAQGRRAQRPHAEPAPLPSSDELEHVREELTRVKALLYLDPSSRITRVGKFGAMRDGLDGRVLEQISSPRVSRA